MIDRVREMLVHKKEYDAELSFINTYLLLKTDAISFEKAQNRKSELELIIATISTWLTLLSDDEAFVIQRHLIDGLDIPRIAVEYEERWGRDFAKSERTIKTYQKRALLKIIAFEKQKKVLLS